jgi:hypothetical protein
MPLPPGRLCRSNDTRHRLLLQEARPGQVRQVPLLRHGRQQPHQRKTARFEYPFLCQRCPMVL